MKQAPNHSFRTPAWRLVGLFRSDPGVLSLQNGRLALQVFEEGLFDVPLDQVHDVTFPGYSFGFAVNLTVNGTRYRLSFLAPPGKIRDLREGLAARKSWKSVLTAQR